MIAVSHTLLCRGKKPNCCLSFLSELLKIPLHLSDLPKAYFTAGASYHLPSLCCTLSESQSERSCFPGGFSPARGLAWSPGEHSCSLSSVEGSLTHKC